MHKKFLEKHVRKNAVIFSLPKAIDAELTLKRLSDLPLV